MTAIILLFITGALLLAAEVLLDASNAHHGFVTWFEVRVVERPEVRLLSTPSFEIPRVIAAAHRETQTRARLHRIPQAIVGRITKDANTSSCASDSASDRRGVPRETQTRIARITLRMKRARAGASSLPSSRCVL